MCAQLLDNVGQRLGINPVLDQGDAVRELLAVEVRIQQRCDLVQDVDDFTRGLALIDFWCWRHGWRGGELVLQRGWDRDAEFGGFARVESPADANRCR